MKKNFIFLILLVSIYSVGFTQFYTKPPVCEFEVDFTNIGFGVLKYYGFRPSKEEIVNLDLELYFKYQLSSSETLILDSLYIYENNTSLDVRVKDAMRSNNITFCKTRYANDYGGFTYIFNVSFDNYKTFDTIIMESTLYGRTAYK
jgi:hypothetical protein